MFSGRLPFQETPVDYWVAIKVKKGKRPARPSDDRCHIRGLDDVIWDIIQACWAQDPGSRPTAQQIVSQIVKHVLSSPGQAVDERPFDHFDPLYPSQTLYSQAEHPFSALYSAHHG